MYIINKKNGTETHDFLFDLSRSILVKFFLSDD